MSKNPNRLAATASPSFVHNLVIWSALIATFATAGLLLVPSVPLAAGKTGAKLVASVSVSVAPK